MLSSLKDYSSIKMLNPLMIQSKKAYSCFIWKHYGKKTGTHFKDLKAGGHPSFLEPKKITLTTLKIIFSTRPERVEWNGKL